MTKKDIYIQVKDIISDIMGDEKNGDLLLETNLLEYGVNSLLFIRIVVNIENQLDLEFDIAYLNLEKYVTLNDLIDYIAEQVLVK